MPIIEVDHVTKEYKLGQLTSLKQTLLNSVNRLAGRPVEERKPFKALDDVHFSVEPGEVLGIIGHNGAGKSTLLKLLSNISKPTSGRIKVQSRIAPLIEVGAGFVPDLTGRENVYLNGTIMGLSRKEIKRKFDEIVSFAEMEKFIDTPVKRYSSGMQVKLAFAVATSIDAEILIVDEVLAVGDLAFQRKCFNHMENLIKRENKTVLLVSHNIRQIERLSSRVMMFESGRVVADGYPADVCNLFYEKSDEKIHSQYSRGGAKGVISNGVVLETVELLDEKGMATDHVVMGSDMTVRITYRMLAEVANPVFGFGIHTTDLLYLASRDSESDFMGNKLGCGTHTVACRISKFPFNPGVFSLRLGVYDGETMVFYGENLLQIRVVARDQSTSAAKEAGFVALDLDWSIVT